MDHLSDRSVQYAPVSGQVEEINETLADQPGLLNKSPEEKGRHIWNPSNDKID